MNRISKFGLRNESPSSGGAVWGLWGFSVGACMLGRAVVDASCISKGDVEINNVVLFILVWKRTIGSGTWQLKGNAA